ncbi:hypothetical protein D9613_007783 [Agrocybe pediades]|uniref:Metal homeostatis protein bsd2 n=1 Tax=Agrocybe pediades TaxID=84607 RepID=A0A8H4VMN6_9AGAR|nr:hypothetical protein D9613_007783 [Agrocybe pediades]
MSSGRYAPLANPHSAPDAEREMADAFDLDDEDNDDHMSHSESTPLTRNVAPSQSEQASKSETSALPGAYDFEREYDFPPPGSPPPPSSRALPNDIGNSNGLLPTAPVAVPKPRRSLFRKMVGAILPTHYQPVPTEGQSSRPTGGGIENDGVFANVTAKPQPARVVRTEDGDVHVVPEDNQKESPPSYTEAQADAVPPYWETTIHTPGMDAMSDLIIGDLPTGSFLIFCLNVFISFFFQFIGFLLTYLLHTSHAAKFGSRAGLGLTLIQYGFYSRTMSFADDGQSTSDGSMAGGATDIWGNPVPAPTPSTETATAATPAPSPNDSVASATSRDWLSFLFMTVGWFLLLSSVIGYWRVKRWENSVRVQPAPPAPEDMERDDQVRRRLESAFGISFDAPAQNAAALRTDHYNAGAAVASEEARLTRDLRAAGIL